MTTQQQAEPARVDVNKHFEITQSSSVWTLRCRFCGGTSSLPADTKASVRRGMMLTHLKLAHPTALEP